MVVTPRQCPSGQRLLYSAVTPATTYNQAKLHFRSLRVRVWLEAGWTLL
jgi:hypothetical protein